MVIVIGIDGQRMIAQRAGNYRPASEPTHFVENRRKKGPTNPLGLVLARVTLFQQDNRGEWFPVVGDAYWDEFAPIRDEWEDDLALGWRKTGRQILDPNGGWPRMPRLMLAKCATMQALRAGWPDQFGSLYAEEEMDRAGVINLMASEAADRAREESRLNAIAGKDAITVSFGDWALENVPVGQFADRVLAWIEAPGRTAVEVRHWAEANRDPLRNFWAKSPSDALELKKVIEAKSKEPSESAGSGQPAGTERSVRSEATAEDASPEKAPAEDSAACPGHRAAPALPTGRTAWGHLRSFYRGRREMRGYQIQRPATAFSAKSRYRRPRRRSDLHLKWIRTLPCAVCGKQGGIHAAHLRAGSPRHGKLATGIGQKPDDSWTTPLCLEHHILGEAAQHQDQELAFWKQHDIDPFVLALALWRASGDDELAFLVINESRNEALQA